ncbi:hypothetical protein [Stenotrophomonas sp.]|uniref:hypothetical protein n=1 Tax=Stenotrophomonas sp. TaxID=69392 RepID=UPI002FC71E05
MSRVVSGVTLALLSGASLLYSGSATAVSGPSNLSASRYPEPRCQPPRRSSGSSASELSRYQNEVKEHFRCVEKYVEAGNNDIKRIQESMDNAVRGAKRY